MDWESEVRKAFRSLPWYILGGWLFLPLALAIFTGGASLAIYAAPLLIFVDGSKHFVGAIAAVLAPGFTLWVFRQFFRAASFSWRKNHITY